jgi:hypothetical protein
MSEFAADSPKSTPKSEHPMTVVPPRVLRGRAGAKIRV